MEHFTKLILSDPATYIRLSFRLLKGKTSWDAIQFLFDHVDLFVAWVAAVSNHTNSSLPYE
jgi:hypothetical protein